MALHLADAEVGIGEFDSVFTRYERIASYHWSSQTRADAIKRATQLHQIEGDSEVELERLLGLASTPSDQAQVQAALGQYFLRHDEFVKAAEWLETSQKTAPHNPDAGKRLLAAARSREKSQHSAKAEKLYLRLGKKYRSYQAQADIGLAELLLSDGKARAAKKYFDRAARRATTDDLVALAQFGVATCLERMGNLDQALAEMDELDLPSRVLDERRDGIRAHQKSEFGGM